MNIYLDNKLYRHSNQYSVYKCNINDELTVQRAAIGVHKNYIVIVSKSMFVTQELTVLEILHWIVQGKNFRGDLNSKIERLAKLREI